VIARAKLLLFLLPVCWTSLSNFPGIIHVVVFFGRVSFQFKFGSLGQINVLGFDVSSNASGAPTLHVQAPAVGFDIQLRWWWSRPCSGSSISFLNISIALSCHCHIRAANLFADTARGSLVAEIEGK
jgi:hypothetical protein